MKYKILLNVIDRIRAEAPEAMARRYMPEGDHPDAIANARSRAYVHLFLKVLFGITDFKTRERYITDGSYDGGIDGYYIDSETRRIYLLQSKFRNTEQNFENKPIELEEILAMDVDRILAGEALDEAGNEYNGKIKQLQREVSEMDDVARYSYHVVVLANLRDISPLKLRKLAGGYPVEVYDHEKVYEKLIFPVISGTYFTASDISMPIDLSNKNAGSKISYTVKTKISDCEITVLFVPTMEIAKIMNKYKNSILKYNPRSYLDLEGKNVNAAIRETILNKNTNEFALYNNGITMLSDETYINERIGQKNKAQLTVKNPQIINGGQTSYTLGRILQENENGNPEAIFENKEVLVKIITLLDKNSHESKLQLIDEISNATNKQTPVINADRFANEIFHQKIQKIVFERYGLMYERKRGEFSDGLVNGYIDHQSVIERNQFLRIYYSANGFVNKGSQKRLFQKNEHADIDLGNMIAFDKFNLGFHVFMRLTKGHATHLRLSRAVYAKVYAYVLMYFGAFKTPEEPEFTNNINALEAEWQNFVQIQRAKSKRGQKAYVDAEGQPKLRFVEREFFRSAHFARDVQEHFGKVTGRAAVVPS